MNMVRAGVVEHPEQWPYCGYREIFNPKKRYSLIDYQRLMGLLQMRDLTELQESRNHWIEEALKTESHVREKRWTETIAVGGKGFVKAMKEDFRCQGERP
jgi:hypothetical protein